MTLASVREGDIVEVDIRGLVFLARVESKERGGVVIKPVCRGISYGFASAKQVREHYRKRRSRS